MSKVCQYATNDDEVCVGMSEVSTAFQIRSLGQRRVVKEGKSGTVHAWM